MKELSTRKFTAVIAISIITLIEICLVIYLTHLCRGINYTAWLGIFLIYQPFICMNFFKSNNTEEFKKFITKILLCTSIPIIVWATLPQYTYEEAKEIIINKYGNKNINFLEYKYGEDTIPVTDLGKFYLRNRCYYFGLETDQGNEFYGVIPSTGETFKLKEDFWRKNKN